MSNKPLNISEEAAVQMPMKTVASLIVIVALGTMGYFQMIERLNQHSTRLELMEKDLTENTDFRIKWPRGQLGSLPADSEQFMLIEHLAGELEKLSDNIETGKAPFDQQQALTLEFFESRIGKLEKQIDELKDKIVNNHYDAVKNGKH